MHVSDRVFLPICTGSILPLPSIVATARRIHWEDHVSPVMTVVAAVVKWRQLTRFRF